MKKQLILVASALFAAITLHAQDTLLVRTVVVENTYNPAIMDANKINVVPSIEEPKVAKQAIAYQQGANLYGALPTYTMTNLVANPAQPTATRGWGNFGYGNYGNLAAKVCYQAPLTPSDELLFALSSDGFNGKIKNSGFDTNAQRFYDTNLNLRYAHQLSRHIWGLNGNVALQSFNFGPDWTLTNDKQSHTLADIAAYFHDTDLDSRWRYALQLGYSHFDQSYQKLLGDNGMSESEIALDANASYRLNNDGVIGLGFNFNHDSYSLKADTPFDNNAEYTFNPYYAYDQEQMQLRLGAKVSILTGNDSHVRFAPDIFIGFPFANTYMFYIEGTGSVCSNSLRDLNRLTPYWQVAGELNNTYTPFATEVGFKASTAEGFNIHIFGGFKVVNDDLLVDATYQGINRITTADLTNVNMGLSAKYVYKRNLNLIARVAYNLWECDNADKPLLYTKSTLDATLQAKGDIQKFTWQLAYQYTARYKGKMDPINDLSLTVGYQLPLNATIWLKGDNLLNQSYQYYWSIPSEKLNVMLGATMRF